MALPRRLRKVFLGLGIFILLLGLAVAALPLWLPWVLGPIGKHYGLHFAGYERVGYQRFALVNASFTNQTTSVRAGRVEGFVPTVWLWKHYFSNQAEPVFVTIKDWHLAISEGASTPKQPKPTAVYSTLEQVDSTLSTLRNWLPSATLSNGAIQTLGTSLQIANAVWKNGTLAADVALPQYQQNFTLSFKSPHAGQSAILLNSPSLHLNSDIRLLRVAGKLNVDATNLWQGNPVRFHAIYNQKNNLPEEALVEAPSFQVPATLLHLPDYQALAGSLSAHWQQNQFSLDLSANAQPTSATNLPPIDLILHARGDTEHATIETAKVLAPGLTAELTEGVNLHFRGPLLTNKVSLNIIADLSRQPWVDLRGMARGQIVLTPTSRKYPTAEFTFAASNIEAQKVRVKAATLGGKLLWPVLQNLRLNAQLADDSTLLATGGTDLEKKTINEGKLQFDGRFGRQFLPTGYSYNKASASLNVSGPWTNALHTGLLKVDHFTGTNLQPMNIQVSWRGEAIHQLHSEAEIVAGNSALVLQTSLETAAIRTNILIKTCTLKTNGEPVLQLSEPCQISILPNRSQTMTPFNWVGDSRELKLRAEIDWPRRGTLTASAHALNSSLLNGFFAKPVQAATIDNLNLSAGWTNGPVNFTLNLSAIGMTPQGMPILASADVRGNADGLVVNHLAVSSKAQPIFTANGFLPVAFNPGTPTNRLVFLEGKPLQFRAMTEPNSIFWNELSSYTGMTIQNPQLQVNVTGSLKSPQGNIVLRADSLKLPQKKSRLPALDHLQVAIKLDRETARIEDSTLLVQGQTIRATGEIPLGETFWSQMRKNKGVPNWQNATGQLTIQNAQLAAFASLLPTVLAPEGVLNANIGLRPGIKLSGNLTIDGAQTRPQGAVVPLRDIKAKLEFVDRTIQLKATVSAGGELVYTQGHIDLQGDKWLQGGLPMFVVTVHGLNVPLARKPELVLRGDLNISVAKTNERPPRITGTIQFHDSVLLQNLNTLIPGRVATPSERPPYFSITDPLLADWQLNLSLLGNRFMRIQNPLFRGEASITMKLTGSLKEPKALGDVKVDSGTVQFPFGNLQVSQGFVSLTSENPYVPQLQVSAAGRQFGYDVKLNVTGPADRPVIEFTSVPPLTSEQILLMLTAGQLPRSDFSFTAQQRIQALALYFGKNLLSRYGIGGGEQRLTVRSGRDISESGKPTYEVEYQIAPKWSLVGEYDRFGDFNGGFKWRIYSR